MKIEWRDVPDYEGLYKASNLGQVKNKYGHILKPCDTRNSYHAVSLSSGGKAKVWRVHRVIAKTFIGPPADPKLDIDHIDGNKINNNVSNLEYVTQRENTKRTFQRIKGEKMGVYYCAKSRKYRTQISINSKLRTIGWYNSEEEAISSFKGAHRAVCILQKEGLKESERQPIKL